MQRVEINYKLRRLRKKEGGKEIIINRVKFLRGELESVNANISPFLETRKKKKMKVN